MPPSQTHDCDKEIGEASSADLQQEYVNTAFHMIAEQAAHWKMAAWDQMQEILMQPFETHCVFNDEFEVEKFCLDALKSKIWTMAKEKGRRGLCFMERTAIVPADVWVERKLCLIGDYDALDRLCASEEITWIL